jgi:hypothetical protein
MLRRLERTPVRSRKVLLATSAAGAILALGLTGCGVVSQITDAAQGKKDVFSIQLGDCTNEDASQTGEVTSVRDVPCDQAHDNEVYLVWELDGDEFPADIAFPGDDAIFAAADSGCGPYFETWIGAPFAETSLNYFPYVPGEESWGQGDREVVCLAFDENGQATGSLEGKGPEFRY